MARNYGREYTLFHKKEREKKRRALRNKARRLAVRQGRVSKGSTKDVAHIGSLKNPRATKIQPRSQNRSFPRKGEKGHGPRKKRK
jgi:hypothetical protein